MKLTVKDLKEQIANMPDDAAVVFQANVPGEYEETDEEPMYTTALGYVFSVFLREGNEANPGDECVIDGAITEQE